MIRMKHSLTILTAPVAESDANSSQLMAVPLEVRRHALWRRTGPAAALTNEQRRTMILELHKDAT